MLTPHRPLSSYRPRQPVTSTSAAARFSGLGGINSAAANQFACRSCQPRSASGDGGYPPQVGGQSAVGSSGELEDRRLPESLPELPSTVCRLPPAVACSTQCPISCALVNRSRPS